MTMEEKVKRKVKGSKKSKKSWRKKVDIGDVEEHLEEKRKDERTVGSFAEKDNENLFFIDKNWDVVESKAVIEKDDQSDSEEEEYVSEKEKRKRKLIKEMKKEKEIAEQARRVNLQNIWQVDDAPLISNGYLESTIKKPKVKPKSIVIGRSSKEAVVLPSSGVSYNPDYDSHQDQLRKAFDGEVEKLKKAEKLNKKVKMVLPDELKKQSKLWLKEMSEGLKQSDADVEIEEEVLKEEKLINTDSIKSKKRKTAQEKRKAKELKEMEKEKLKEQKEKQKKHELTRIKSLKREILHEEEVSSKKQKLKMEKKQQLVTNKTKRLSKHKYQDAELVFQLSEDLSGSLREMKPEGNLLEERFKSLQKRNIIEARKPVIPHRKYKKKINVKRSYRTATIKEFKSKHT